MKASLGGALAALLISTAAQAATVVTTYEGTVSFSSGDASPFGTNLLDLAYTAVFTTDTSKGRQSYENGGVTYDEATGNASAGTLPLQSASFTLNGVTISLLQFSPTTGAAMFAGDDGSFGHGSAPDTFGFAFIFRSPDAPSNIDTPFTTMSFTNFDAYIEDGASGYVLGLAGTRVTNEVLTAAIPEPATWALLITGFGLAGAALRHRPQVLARAA